MKNIFRILVLLVFTTNVSCAKKVKIDAKWQTAEVTVDGNSSEWNVPLRYFDSKSKLNYQITNDGQSLYIAFRLTDMDVINQFNFGGITIELDTLPGKELTHMLKYPAGGGPMPMMGEDMPEPDFNSQNEQEERPMPQERMGMQKPAITLKGVSGYRKEVTIALEELDGIEASHEFDIDSQVLFCEIKVPYYCLEMNPTQKINLDNTFKMKLSLGNDESGRPAPPQGGGNGMQGPPPGGGNPPMGGGPGGGGFGGRPDGQGPPDMPQSNAKKQEINLEIKLATNP